MDIFFGEMFRARRLQIRVTLREFCELNSFDPVIISKIERSKLPPDIDQLPNYAKALSLIEGTPEYFSFMDAGKHCYLKGPLTDQELMKKLPVLGLPPNMTDENLTNLAEIIREL